MIKPILLQENSAYKIHKILVSIHMAR